MTPPKSLNSTATLLLRWYERNKRDFPWRLNRDPYRIWISETMLQQTTTTAVVPYFTRFIERFPTLNHLAAAKTESVLEAWAGLGYYSRARNLHRAAMLLNQMDNFPDTHQELIKLPGLGPYTARAVASLAFDEGVGVVDGNVIRVFSRYHATAFAYWRTEGRNQLQDLADRWVNGLPSCFVNQALMELGRTICTPKSPSCLLCPLNSTCLGLKASRVESLPVKKPRRAREIWIWNALYLRRSGRILLAKNPEIPFLSKHWNLPGKAVRAKKRPKHFHFKHSVTHHDIYVRLQTSGKLEKSQPQLWVSEGKIRQYAPTSVIQKVLQLGLKGSSFRRLPAKP